MYICESCLGQSYDDDEEQGRWKIMSPKLRNGNHRDTSSHWWTEPLLTDYNERWKLTLSSCFNNSFLFFLSGCSSGLVLLSVRVYLCVPFYLVVFDYVLISRTTSYFTAASLGCQASPQHMQLYLIMQLWIQNEALYTVDCNIWAGAHTQQ